MDQIAGEIDAREGERAKREARDEAGEARLVRDPVGEAQADAEPDDRAADVGPALAVGGLQATPERRRAVGRRDHRLGERKQQGTADEARHDRRGGRERDEAGKRHHRREAEHDGEEHRAIDEALGGAAAPLGVGRREGRRRAVQRVDREPGDDIDDRPKAGLGDARGRDRGQRLKRRSRAEQGRQVGDARGEHGVEGRAEQQRMEAPVALGHPGHEEPADAERHLGEDEQRRGPADEHRDGRG